MKRTEMKRTPFVTRPKAPNPDRAPRITHNRGVSSIWRSDAYLALVRSLPCASCGAHNLTESAHSNRLMYGKARGLKASDATAMPLCRTILGRNGCHAELDQGRTMSKDQRNRFEDQHICKTIYDLIDSGRLISVGKLPAMDCGLDEMAAHLVRTIECGELLINK